MNDDLRTLLAEQLSNEKIPPDGEIYRKIRQHCLKPLAAARWWACLTENKQYELKRLLRRDDFTAAFDALLDIPGLWRDGMRLGVTKDMMGLKCDEVGHRSYTFEAHWTVKLQEMFHCLDHVRTFWAGLFRHDKRDMQKVDYVTVKALELKAPGTSTSDTMTLFHQLKKGEIFGAFNMDRRMEIWAKLHAWEGLVPTLWTFFENFKYIEACANCVKNLITVPFRGTLYTAMARSFSETTQTRGKYIIQEAESVFALRSSNTQDRVALHYREIFLYVMRHLRELSPGSTKVEPKPTERKSRMTKDPDKSALYGLADLAERLGFKSTEISDLKAKYSSHANVRSQSRPSKPTFVVDGPGECPKRRCACPYDLAYEQSREFLFLDNMHSTDRSQGSSIQPVFVRRSVYLAYFGRISGDHDSEGYAPQEQPNAEETREDRDHGQAENNEEQDGINPEDTSEWQNYMNQLGDSPPRSQGLHESQSMNDVEEPAPSIISSSFYSDEVLLEERSLEEDPPKEETPLQAIASARIETTKKDELPQDRFKFIFRQGDDWIPMEQYPFDPSLSSLVKLTAEKHASEGRYLFDTALWSLHPSDCFEAAMAYGSHVILVFPAGRIHNDQHIATSAFQLGDNARPLEGNTRKRAVNNDIFKEDHIRKKQIV